MHLCEMLKGIVRACIVKNRWKIGLLVIFINALTRHATAQSEPQEQQATTAWLFYTNKHTFNKRWTNETDLHLRSNADLQRVGNILFRTWVSYALTENSTTGLGYTYLGTWDDDLAFPDRYLDEHRIFQQYENSHDLFTTLKLKHRGRLEQRFFSNVLHPAFSLRARYAITIKKQIGKVFAHNGYLIAENELFFNLIGRKLSGNRLLEQNRVFGGFGVASKSNSSIEIGSYYEVQHDPLKRKNKNLILQLKISTAF